MKQNKYRIIVLVLLMSIIMTGFNVSAKSNKINDKIETFIMSTDIKVLDEENHILPAYKKDSKVRISFEWSVEDVDLTVINEDSFYEIDLGNQVKFTSIVTENDLYQLVGNTVQIKVNSDMKETKGTVIVDAKLPNKVFSSNTYKIITEGGEGNRSEWIVNVEQDEVVKATKSESNLVSVSRFNIYTNPEKDRYLSGEEILFFTGFSITEDSGVLKDAIVEIKIPKENIVPGTFIASDIASQISKETGETETHYLVKYYLSPLSSGTSIDVPLKFVTENGDTPNGFPIPVDANLYSNSGQNKIADVNKVFIIETYEPKIIKQINVQGWTGNDGYEVIGGKESMNEPGYLTSNLEDLTPVVFSYSVQNNSYSTSPGNRKFSTLIFKDKVPEGAVFDSELNPGWTYDSVTRVATFEYQNDNGLNLYFHSFYNDVTLKLLFPNQKLGETKVNHVELEAIPYNKPDYESITIAKDSISFSLKAIKATPPPTSFISRKSAADWSLYDYQVDRDKTNNWTVSMSNPADPKEHADLNIKDVSITDRGLDPLLKYKGIKFKANYAPTGTVNVYVNYLDGTRETIAENLDLSTSPTFEFTRGKSIMSIDVFFGEGTYLAPGKRFEFIVQTELRNKQVEVVDQNASSRTLYNYVDFEGTFTNGTKYTAKSVRDYIRFLKLQPKVELRKSILNYKNNYFINDSIDYSLQVNAYQFHPDLETTETNMIVDILPEGLEYTENSASIIVYSGNSVDTDMKRGVYKYEPKVVNNYKDTGRTALIWELKPFSFKEKRITSSFNGVYTINYSTRITEVTKQGLNKNIAYLSWLNNDEVIPYDRSIGDKYDLNGNQSVLDKITYAEESFNYVPPRELIIRKEVQGSLDSNYVLPPSTGLGEIGTNLSYRFTLFNNSVMDINRIQLLDLFPKVGDMTVSEDLSLNPAQRIPRASDFEIKLSGPITVPNGYRVLYNTSELETNPQAYYRSENWVTSLEDYGFATAFKVELVEGNLLKVGEEQTFIVNFKIPNDINLNQNDQIVNSFGVSTNQNLDFFESNLSTLKIVKYKVDGYVFDDFNENGQFDSIQEEVFKNYQVELIDDKGNLVLDLEGNPYRTVTNEDGFYHFDVYREGNYRVRILTPEGYLLTNTGGGEYGSHISQAPVTNSFRLDRFNPYERKNAGYYKETVSLKIEKNLLSRYDDEFDSTQAFTFVLTIDGVPYNGKAEINSDKGSFLREETLEEGRIKISSMENIVIHKLPKESQYHIEELECIPFKAEEKIQQGTLDKTNISITFINKVDDIKTTYTVNKKWHDGPDQHPSIQIQLYQNDKKIGKAVTLNDGELTHTWNDLEMYDKFGNKFVYTAREINVLDNYVDTYIDTDYETTINNTYKIPMTSFTTHKIWINGPEIKPTIEIQLYQDGTPYGLPVTFKHGKTDHTWSELPLTDSNGNVHYYTVDEITKLSNYEKKVEESTIINTYVSGKIAISTEKVWIGGPKNKPTIKIQLYRNGLAYGDPVSLKNGETRYIWTNLDVRDNKGNPYIYTVDEISKFHDYEKSIVGNTIYNTYKSVPTESEEPKVNPKEDLPGTGLSSSHLYLAGLMIGVGTLFVFLKKSKD